jgi:hypothetical protein
MHNAGGGAVPLRQKGLEEALSRRGSGAAPPNTAAHVSKAPSLLLDMLSSAQRCVLHGAPPCGSSPPSR